MLQTTLTFSNTPNKQELLKEMQEDFPVEVKLSSENCIEINHGVVNCSLILSDKEIIISTIRKSVWIKKLLFRISVGLVVQASFLFATGFKFHNLSDIELGKVPVLGFIFILSIFAGQPSKIKLHNVVADFLKEDHGGQDSQ